jgi:hypothetical protein
MFASAGIVIVFLVCFVLSEDFGDKFVLRL